MTAERRSCPSELVEGEKNLVTQEDVVCLLNRPGCLGVLFRVVVDVAALSHVLRGDSVGIAIMCQQSSPDAGRPEDDPAKKS